MLSLQINGNVTKDPEIKSTTSGKKVVSFSVAVNKGKDKTLFMSCVAWEKTAELINDYVKKGDRFAASGELDIREYEDSKTGEKKKAYEMIIREFDFPPKRGDAAETPEPKKAPRPSADELDSEIPF